MGPSHSFLYFYISCFFQSSITAHAAPRPAAEADVADIAIAPKHAALAPRANEASTITRPGWTSTITALTFFTPSPGAGPIPITSQSQEVTSYVPILTICPFIPSTPALPTLAANTSFSAPTAPFPAPSASDASALYRRQAAATSATYANDSAPTSYLSSCSVSYTPTPTQICHTTLSPLASPAIPVTDCTQQVTFSTDHGYTMVPGNVTASIRDLTTYYAARWDEIANGVPTQGIRKEVCSTDPVGGCSTGWEAWWPSTVCPFYCMLL